MKISIKKIQSKDQPFFLVYGIYLFFSYINLSLLGGYLPGIYYLVCILSVFSLLLLEFLHKNMSIISCWELILAITLLLLIDYSRGTISFESFAVLIVFIISGKERDISKIIWFTMIISVISLILIVVSSQIGIIDDYVSNYYGRLRHYLGFTYCLYPSRIIASITMMYVFLKENNLTIGSSIVLLCINLIFYYATDSRIAFASVIFIVFFSNIYNYIKQQGIPIKGFKVARNFLRIVIQIVITFIYPICCIVSFWCAVKFDSSNKMLSYINTYLGNRIVLAQKSLLMYGMKWHGQNIQWNGAGLSKYGTLSKNAYNWVDNVYIKMFQSYGYIFGILIIFGLTFFMYRLAKTNKVILTLIFVILAVNCMFEDILMQLCFNPFWFFVPSLFRKKEKKENIS